MPRFKFSVNHIFHKLREAEAILTEGESTKDASRSGVLMNPHTIGGCHECKLVKLN